jgi:hypothetical protein
MAAKRARRNAVAVGDLATELLDPLLRKRAGMSIALVQSWDEIVGERLADMSRPEKIAWPRRAHEDDPFEPATLIVACEGVAAMRIQHETGEIIARVNAFLGFGAIGRIRIVRRRSPRRFEPRPKPRPLDEWRMPVSVASSKASRTRACAPRWSGWGARSWPANVESDCRRSHLCEENGGVCHWTRIAIAVFGGQTRSFAAFGCRIPRNR